MNAVAGTGEVHWVEASDGRRLAWRFWPAEHCRGIVLAVHGIQSHSGWYGYSSQRLSEAGFSVCFADRRGSGLNGRERGHALHGMQLVNDLRTLRAEVLSKHPPETPLHLLGLSWGGKIAAAAAALFPAEFSSLILLYPGLFPLFGPTWFQRLQLRMARQFEIVRPHVPIPLEAPSLFTDNPQFQDFIADDPLALHTVSSSLLNAGRDLDEILQSGLSEFHRPVLVMLAGGDQIIDNGATRKWLQKQALPDLKIIEWPNARHTLEFAANREEIFDSLIDWLRIAANER
jgi:alpha-beta hydrolase superfamily lysophospholipase